MITSLDKLIAENRDELMDSVVKDAIRSIPSYGGAPLMQTVGRVERWLDALASSIQENEPEILERYLNMVAAERREEGYAIGDLHMIVRITEEHLGSLVSRKVADQVDRNAHLLLLEAVMGAARMVLSVTYVLMAHGKS
jgi:hypothetical protein